MIVSPFLARAKIRPKFRFASEILIVFMRLTQGSPGPRVKEQAPPPTLGELALASDRA